MYFDAYTNIDYERLDLNIQNKDLDRRCGGRTFATIMLMLGEAWLGDPGNQYLYVGETYTHTYTVRQEFALILRAEGFTLNCDDAFGRINVFGPNRCQFYFIVPEAAELVGRGRRWSDAFIDLTNKTRWRYHTPMQALQIS